MNNHIKRAGVATALVGSLGVGALLGGPSLAAAADDTTAAAPSAPGAARTDAIAALVTDGTLTQEQADKVNAALDAARPDGPGGPGGPDGGHHGGPGGGPHVETAATALGISEGELRTALEADDATIASVASDKGVDLQVIIDALVAAENERIDQQVADGKLTTDQATERKAGVTERVTALVNGERPERPAKENAPTAG